MVLFRILWGFDAIASTVVIYFFFTGLTDNSVSGNNIIAWLLILATIAGILLGSIWLRIHQHQCLSLVPLAVIAFPALFYLLYILLAVFGNVRWN